MATPSVVSGTFTADGSSATWQPALRRTVGKYAKPDTVIASGDFGGGTLTVEVSADNVTWVALTDGTTTAELTDDGVLNVQANVPFMRLTLADSTDADIDYWINGAE